MPENNTSETAASSSHMQLLNNLAHGSFGLAKNAYHKTSDGTKYVVRRIQESPHTAQVVDATKNVYNSSKDYRVVQWTGATVGTVADVTYKVGHGTVAAGNYMYNTISGSPITEQILRWTGSTVKYMAGAGYKAAVAIYGTGRQVCEIVSTSPLTGPVVRFTGAAIGSAFTLNLMATSVASRAGRELVKASCIRNSLWIFSKLHLPNTLRASAVYAGVRTHNYIASGVIPGLFTAWAIYDGYRVARYCYDMYQDKERERLQRTDRFNQSVQMWFDFPEDLVAQQIRIKYFGMYAPQ